MKTRFTNLDIVALIPELNDKLKGLRVNQVYDIDNKTYLIRFNNPSSGQVVGSKVDADGKLVTDGDGNQDKDLNDEDASKIVLLIESAVRFHTTVYKWPKNVSPNGFTMKLRKHLKNKRLEHIVQVGVDRIVDLQFGSKEAAYHVIVELYDRGNILITDHEFTILNILRPRKAGTEDADVKFMVREKYPLHLALTKDHYHIPSEDELEQVLKSSKPGDTLRKIFVPRTIFGPALLESCFIDVGIPENVKIGGKDEINVSKVRAGLLLAEEKFLKVSKSKNPGIIIANEEKRVKLEHVTSSSEVPKVASESEIVLQFKEFHPMLFSQHQNSSKQVALKYQSFDETIDLFFSSLEGQKIDAKQISAEKEALKKLDRVKDDHLKRIKSLSKSQESDERKARLIESNLDLVDKAINFMKRTILENNLPVNEINNLIKEAKLSGSPVAPLIKGIDLKNKTFMMDLFDPFDEEDDEDNKIQDGDQNQDKQDDGDKKKKKFPERVVIDITCTAYSNARKYFEKKKIASSKEIKTVQSSARALKSASIKTSKQLKEAAITSTIIKSRKIYWFEKFNWFISSENYLVLAGKDAAQNELLVKRYLKQGDLYVHADLHGASSVIIKNNYKSSGDKSSQRDISGDISQIPPKTISEAAVFAVAYSSAWEAKISCRSWFVHADQVSKTAPSGEYLSLGSFMIRGKKNFLPMPQLQLAFGFLFKLDSESIKNHENERCVKNLELFDTLQEAENSNLEQDQEVEVSSSEDEESSQGQGQSSFPDTKIRTMSINSDVVKDDDEDNEIIIINPAASKVKQGAKKKEKKEEKKDEEEITIKTESLKNGPMSKRQKHKMMKIKNKYKDQDEEERKLRMALLGHDEFGQSVNEKKSANKKQGNKKKGKEEKFNDLKNKMQQIKQINQKEETEPENEEPEVQILAPEDEPIKEEEQDQEPIKDEDQDEQPIREEDEDEEDEDETQAENDGLITSHVELLNSLTGIPGEEDVLLFCIPVVGPATALANYKFKVNVLPGNHRRGKLAKTALHLFTMDKNCSQREKDLLKATKDVDIGRNLPKNIKITSSSAAHKAARKKN